MIKIGQEKRWKVLPNVDYGRDLDATFPLAPNFKYGEAVESAIAVELGIANVPTEAEWKTIETFAVFILQPLRNRKGRISLSSWFRCAKLNRHPKIGSTEKSYHEKGGAGDLEPHECSLMELLEEAHTLNYSEIIAEYFPNGWVHVAFIKGDDRRRLKLKDADRHYELVTIEQLRELYPSGGQK
jgi:uncharacterized protein YcbK (DUF882 family)